jgi:transposase
MKAHELLQRRGIVVPERTLHRYALEVLGVSRANRRTTVRVADGEPGVELQVDFGKMGLVPDPATGRKRVCWALIFAACYSRHCYVWLSFRQTTEVVISGFEAAWAFFGGVFKVVIPDNMSSIVVEADNLEPSFNQAFVEYAQDRGFLIDPARVRTPTDNAMAESVNSRFKLECVWKDGPWRGRSDLELATASWVAWWNDERLHGELGYMPPAEFEHIHYGHQQRPALAVGNQ